MATCSECGEGIAAGDAEIYLRHAGGKLCGACASLLYPESMARLAYSGAYPVALPTCSICREVDGHTLSCPTRWYR